MPTTPHVEKHFTSSAIVRDIVIGMSDGLTVPFALAAGLTGAVDTTTIIITAGIAEIAAGSIAMGLGGYLAGKTDVEHFETERAREIRETEELPEKEKEEVATIFQSYGLEEETVGKVVKAISADRKRWVDFMMRFELGLEEPDPRRARTSAIVIAVSYIVGGLVPLVALLLLRFGESGIADLCRRDACCLGGVRLCEGAVHRRQAAEKCLANCGRRRIGGCGRVRNCSHDRMTNRHFVGGCLTVSHDGQFLRNA